MNSPTRYSSLAEKHVFITGGASGIGAALVTAFAQQGAKVSFVDLDHDEAKNLIQKLSKSIQVSAQSDANEQSSNTQSSNTQSSRELPNNGIKYIPIFSKCDVTQIETLQHLIKATQIQQGNIDILINNVANDQRFSSEKITPQQWRESLAINLDPTFFASQAVQPMMSEQGGGVIINFSSINAHLGPNDMPSYITAKAGILGMTKSLASDFGQYNIRVNSILPGWVVTEKQLKKWLTPEAEKEWMNQVCLNKRIQPEDVAKLALFLASDDASMITSQEFVIDGGRT